MVVEKKEYESSFCRSGAAVWLLEVSTFLKRDRDIKLHEQGVTPWMKRYV